MIERDLLSGRAVDLRHSFDRSFAEPPRSEAGAAEDLLLVRVGSDAYALRLVECAGLFVDRKVTPLPTHLPELLGLAGFRTSLVPVYDLRALLGYPRGEALRWMISTAGDVLVALAFDAFEAHVRVERDSLVLDATATKRHADRVARLTGGPRPVLSLSSVVQTIEARARRDP